MKLKIASLVSNENYFFPFFVEYYQKQGIDEIILFIEPNNDPDFKKRLHFLENTENVRLVSTLPCKWFGYESQTILYNYLLQYAFKDFKKTNQDSWWAFVDADEFIRTRTSFSLKKDIINIQSPLIRTVFLEWYLPPNFTNKSIPLKQMLELARAGSLRGEILTLWGDPLYKDYIIHLNSNNLILFEEMSTIAGFHQFVRKNQVQIFSDAPFLIVDHLKGIPKEIFQERLNQRLNKINDRDDWSYHHHYIVSENLKNYTNYYKSQLKSNKELITKINRLNTADYDESYFNTVIMKENLKKNSCSRPSDHGIFF